MRFTTVKLKLFTFQSGYILIRCACSSFRTLISFTFQSGYILITLCAYHHGLAENFTFQSGYILMQLNEQQRKYLMLLYIPIWLYSNYIFIKVLFGLIILYIPIWLYSNIQKLTGSETLQPLHSNLVIF